LLSNSKDINEKRRHQAEKEREPGLAYINTSKAFNPLGMHLMASWASIYNVYGLLFLFYIAREKST